MLLVGVGCARMIRTVTYEKSHRDLEKWWVYKTCPVTPDERAAVEQLVSATWDAQHVGHGKDAANLLHKSVTVSLCPCPLQYVSQRIGTYRPINRLTDVI